MAQLVHALALAVPAAGAATMFDLPARAADPAAVVYWATNPVRPNETVLVAGAGLKGATVEWCHTTETCAPALAAVGESAVRAVLPSDCTTPCALRITT